MLFIVNTIPRYPLVLFADSYLLSITLHSAVLLKNCVSTANR